MSGLQASGKLTNAAVMHVDYPRLSPLSTLRDALDQLSQYDDRYAVVETDDRFLGIVSDRDLRLALPSRLQAAASLDNSTILDETSVMAVCIRRPFTAHPRGLAIASAQFMLQKGIGCLPVVDDEDEILGLITLRDFTRIFAAFSATELTEGPAAVSDGRTRSLRELVPPMRSLTIDSVPA